MDVSSKKLLKGLVILVVCVGFTLLAGTVFDLAFAEKAQMALGELSRTDFEILVLYTLMIGLLGLSLYRRNKFLDLQAAVMERQSQEFDLQERALNAHAIVSVTDSDGILSSVNEKLEDALGRKRTELIGMPESSLYASSGASHVQDEIRNRLSAGKIWSGENLFKTADGSLLNMQGTIVPLHDQHGQHIKNVAIWTDVTASRKSENARVLKSFLDHMHDEVYVYEVDTLDIRYVNLRAMERCDWTEETVAGKRISDSDALFDERAFRAHVAPLFNGAADSVTIEVKQAKGPVEIKTRLHVGEDGEMLFLSVLRDITERKKLERAKMETVSVVSHELRTPITSIKGALRLLRSGVLGPVSDKALPVLEIADRNSERLLLVVNDILDLEKIRSGKMRFDLERTDLVTFLADAVAMNKGYGDELHVQFMFETDVEQAEACVSSDRMMQVMSNLMSNAAKFSPDGATVRIGLHDRGDVLRISVTDEGPGIPESARKAVFDSFSQLDNVDEGKRKGTGLGLTISKSIVDAHGGTLDFRSAMGKGTTFFADLPRASEHDQTPAQISSSAAA